MNKAMMNDMREAVESLRDHYAGKKTLRTHHVPAPKPVRLTAASIRRLRQGLNLSQELFARCLHTSRRTVEKWEQGSSHPTGATAALLALLRKRNELIEDLVAVA